MKNTGDSQALIRIIKVNETRKDTTFSKEHSANVYMQCRFAALLNIKTGVRWELTVRDGKDDTAEFIVSMRPSNLCGSLDEVNALNAALNHLLAGLTVKHAEHVSPTTGKTYFALEIIHPKVDEKLLEWVQGSKGLKGEFKSAKYDLDNAKTKSSGCAIL